LETRPPGPLRSTVWRKAHLFSDSRGNIASWVFTIARNLKIDRLRKEVAWQEFVSIVPDYPSNEPLSDDIVASNQVADRIRASIAELPDDQRAVIVLSFIDGLSHNEIATKLALPLGTIKSRMRLAYLKLRQSIEGLK
jgi:RNA polymerase sigma-70 factor (ECF subfamily)